MTILTFSFFSLLLFGVPSPHLDEDRLLAANSVQAGLTLQPVKMATQKGLLNPGSQFVRTPHPRPQKGVNENQVSDHQNPSEALLTVVAFAEKHMPNSAGALKTFLSQSRDQAGIQRILREGSQLIQQVDDHREKFGNDPANILIQATQASWQLIMLGHQMDRSSSTPNTSGIALDDSMKKPIRQLGSDRNALLLKVDRGRLEAQRSSIVEWESDIKDRQKMATRKIAEQLEEFYAGIAGPEPNQHETLPQPPRNADSIDQRLPIMVTDNDLAAAAKLNYQQQVYPLFEKHCFQCHGEQTHQGDLDLQTKLLERPLVKNRTKWISVLQQIRNHAMPPPEDTTISRKQRTILASWLHYQIHHFDYSAVDNPGLEGVRRMTHLEYSYTVDDLFGMPLQTRKRFPSSMSGSSGFANSGNSLFIEQLLMERYLQVAESIAGKFMSAKVEATASRETFFRLTPGPSFTPEAAIQKNLTAFLPRAFRRPVALAELNSYLKIFKTSFRESKSFEIARDAVVQSILISPNFLFLNHSQPTGSQSEKIDHWQVANRLSYFLWSSMPDRELFRLAKEKRLDQAEVLSRQVERMLTSPKSNTLGSVFAAQWLGFQHVGTRIRADPIDNPWCTDSLMKSMKMETSLFFQSLIRDNRPLSELLTADYTFLNEELANHYRIEGVKGKQMRRVKVNGVRGGIFGQASILAITSYPHQTSPVKRGTWILTDLLGTPPPPPPPGASEFAEEIEESESLSFRQKLQRHSRQPQCASCHAQIDPLGFGLEQFDWFGRTRTRSRGRRIDSRGTLPDGTSFTGVSGLKTVIIEKHIDEIATQITRKLLSFGLGRQLEYYDEKAVRKIVADAKSDNYRLQNLIKGVISSYPFQFQRIQTD